MNDSKITNLPNNNTINDADLLLVVDDVAGTPVTEKRTVGQMRAHINPSRVISLLLNDSTVLTTGDGKAYVRVPNEYAGMNLVDIEFSRVAGTGVPLVQVHNVTQAADMLTTRVSIDSGETDSKDATTAAVIDTANDDVAAGDRLRIDVDDAGTSTTWAEIQLVFALP